MQPSSSKVEYFCSNIFKTGHARYLYRYKRIEADSLVAMLKDGIKYIDNISVRFSEINTDAYFDHFRDNIVLNKSNWPKWCSILDAEAAVATKGLHLKDAMEAGEVALRTLASMNASNTAALAAVKAGLSVINQKIYLLDGIVSPILGKASLNNIGTIYPVSMIDGVMCDTCRAIRDRKEMGEHKFHPECIIEADKNRMKAKEFVKVDGMAELLAIREAGIAHEMVSTFYDIWTQPWVVDAIDAYRKSGTEYAGMTLAEFLRAMKPESNP